MDTVGDSDKRDVRRPMNAFLIFCKRHRSIVREKNPDLDNRSVTRILGDLWANLKDDEKVVYTDLAKQYKDAFMKANPDYKWHNPEKAVTCQKTGLPVSKPTNVKVIKNDINLLPEGSIMPGKLADPCNMGGLSLLLMAGEQQSGIDQRVMSSITGEQQSGIDQRVMSSITGEQQSGIDQRVMSSITGNYRTTDVINHLSDNSDVDQHVGVIKTVVDGVNEMSAIKTCLDSNVQPPVSDQDKLIVDEKLKNTRDSELPVFRQSSTIPLTKLKDSALTKPLLYQTVAAPKVPVKSLLADAFKGCIDKDGNSEILKVNSASTKMANFENQGHVLENRARNDVENKLICKVDEKENITQKVVTDVKLEEDVIKDEESPMVTCGKLVVNHIIDRLYSSDLATGRKVIGVRKDEVDGGTDVNDNKDANMKDLDTVGSVKDQGNVSQSIIKDENRPYKEVDKHDFDEMMNVKSEILKDTDFDKDKGLNEGNDSSNTQNRKSGKGKGSVAANRGEDSTESEEVDDYQPVRKSRRRNRGQRYQELINEGIIQLSKERMAALQQPCKKEESPDEDLQAMEAYNSYILPETAIRRIRKRTTSESAKDKLYHTDDVKRYKTGDFDLEAQIATLPVCSVENMGRKRGFARQRHNSECIHTQRKLSDMDHLASSQPAFNVEKIVTLPPHIKVIPDTVQEPVVGSRKRKARKHSITHMVPAPATLIKNGIVKPEVNCLGPCLIKPSETSVPDKNDTKGHEGEVAMETNKCAHSNSVENCKITSKYEKVTDAYSELNSCDKTGEVPLSDCVHNSQTGSDQSGLSDSHSSPNIETQSGNISADRAGAQTENGDTVWQPKLTQELDIDEKCSTIDSEGRKSDKTEVSMLKKALKFSEVNSDQMNTNSDGYDKRVVKNETDLNSNNTINYTE